MLLKSLNVLLARDPLAPLGPIPPAGGKPPGPGLAGAPRRRPKLALDLAIRRLGAIVGIEGGRCGWRPKGMGWPSRARARVCVGERGFPRGSRRYDGSGLSP